MKRRVRMSAAVAATLLFAGACAERAEAPARTRQADALVLRVATFAGTPAPNLAAVPDYSLYGDGTVIQPGPRKGSLVTALVSSATGPEANRLYQTAHDVGLASDQRYAGEQATDASLVRVMLRSGKVEHHTGLVTAGSLPGPPELSEFVDSLRERKPDEHAAEVPIGRLAVVAVADPAESDLPTEHPRRPWPFTAPSAGEELPVGNCVVLTGDSATTAAGWARQTSTGTRWLSEGVRYQMLFRPLLPDENGCSALDTG